MLRSIILMLTLILCSDARASWTMVVIPDTQNYRTPSTIEVFNSVTQWIVDNKDSRNIQYVTTVGDITHNNTAEQWADAAGAYDKLNGVVPYFVTTGNHDYSAPLTDRDTPINDYFSLSDNPLNAAITTERIVGNVENTYTTFTAPDGRNILLFGIEFWPRPEVVAWADSVASQPQFRDYTAILATHAYMAEGPAVGGVPQPDRQDGVKNLFWNPLVGKNGNFELVLNGHALDNDDPDPDGPLTTARQFSVGVNGNVVHEIGFNAQQQPNGGNGYIRLMEFLDDKKTVQVRTYSPTLNVWLTDDLNEFQIAFTQVTTADFNEDGSVNSSDFPIWRLGFGELVRAIVTDGDADGDEDVDGRDFLAWQQSSAGGLVGDFDASGTVDAGDLLRWETGFGLDSVANLVNGNADGDGDVDGQDFLTWQRAFAGQAPLAANASVPEPGNCVLGLLASVLAFAMRRSSTHPW